LQRKYCEEKEHIGDFSSTDRYETEIMLEEEEEEKWERPFQYSGDEI
jgi:hypothetical protein